METFTLIAWFWWNDRFGFERAEIKNMSHTECVERFLAIHADRGVKGHCLGTAGTIAPRAIQPEPMCAHTGGSCAWPLLPGRKRI